MSRTGTYGPASVLGYDCQALALTILALCDDQFVEVVRAVTVCGGAGGHVVSGLVHMIAARGNCTWTAATARRRGHCCSSLVHALCRCLSRPCVCPGPAAAVGSQHA
eukprot:3495190-Rhodomonas_salina.2